MKKKINKSRAEISEKVIGQSKAIEAVKPAIRRAKSWHEKSKATNWIFFISWANRGG